MEQIKKIIEDCCNQVSIILRYRSTFEISQSNHNKNSSGDEVNTFDVLVNNIFVEKLKSCHHVRCIGSEEEEELCYTDYVRAPYMVCIDPLDGSSNLGINITTGTIFCVYEYKDNKIINGHNIVLAGYCLYGACTQMIIAKDTIDMYQLTNHQFVKIKNNIKIPEKGKYFSINNSYKNILINDKNNTFVEKCTESGYNSRWVGSMVADVHRIILEGGVFMYPANKKNENGKIRLLYEAYPFAYIFKVGGGYSYHEHEFRSILDVPYPVDHPHEKVPILLSGKEEFDIYIDL